MALDDLEHRLEQYEARLREARLLLAQQRHRRAATPEDTLAIAAGLFEALSVTDALTQELNRRLKDESEARTQAIRQRQYEALKLSYVPPASIEPPDYGSEKLYGRDDDEAAGNAPVPAFPRRPVPVLVGGAARRFEESDEPPRNP